MAASECRAQRQLRAERRNSEVVYTLVKLEMLKPSTDGPAIPPAVSRQLRARLEESAGGLNYWLSPSIAQKPGRLLADSRGTTALVWELPAD